MLRSCRVVSDESTDMKIGIIGFGGMGTLHATQIAYIEGVEIKVVVEPGETNRAKVERFFAGKDVALFSDLESALSQSNLEGWIVTSSTKTHIPIAQQLLAHGCKVLLEKPLAPTYEETRILEALVKSDSSNLMLGHILLWNKEFQTLNAEVANLGAITAINCSRQRSASHRVQYPGESPFSLIMVHDLYTVHSLMSAEQPVRFSAQVREHSQGGVDLALGQMTWKTNAFASLVANYLIPDGVEGGGNIDEICVSGDGWHVKMLYDSGFITITRRNGSRQVQVSPPTRVGATNYFDDALRSEQEHFFNVIRGKASVPVGARYEDACQIQEWIGNFISLTLSGGTV
jgi:predicted dehydrogenase